MIFTRFCGDKEEKRDLIRGGKAEWYPPLPPRVPIETNTVFFQDCTKIGQAHARKYLSRIDR